MLQVDGGLRWVEEPTLGKGSEIVTGYFSPEIADQIERTASDFRCPKSAVLRGLILLGLDHPPAEYPPVVDMKSAEKMTARVSHDVFAKVANLTIKQPPGTAMHRIVNGLVGEGLKRLEEEGNLYLRKRDELVERMERFGLRDSTINKLLLTMKDLSQLEKIVEDLEEAKKAGAEKRKAK